MVVSGIELGVKKDVRGQGGQEGGRRVGLNNFFRGNIQRPLPGALAAMPSNYSPRPPVIIPITSRTEESVTQHAGQGEGKATERRINISFTHPALPSRAWIKCTKWRRDGGREQEGWSKEGKERRSAGKHDTRPLISSGFWVGAGSPGDGAGGGQVVPRRTSKVINQEQWWEKRGKAPRKHTLWFFTLLFFTFNDKRLEHFSNLKTTFIRVFFFFIGDNKKRTVGAIDFCLSAVDFCSSLSRLH